MGNTVKISDLRPRESRFLLRGTEHTLRPFTLGAQAWVATEFCTPGKEDGLENLSKAFIDLNGPVLGRLGYYLLRDKTKFVNEEDFIDAFGTQYNLFKTLLPALNECIGLSQPQTDDISEELEIKK